MEIKRGEAREAIFKVMQECFPVPMTASEIARMVGERRGIQLSPSTIRSCLGLNVPGLFSRTGRGRYVLANAVDGIEHFDMGLARLYHMDCFEWLRIAEHESISAVVTDPPYGLVEYSSTEKDKLKKGRGGVWRLPPEFDGCKRSPVPRFTTLTEGQRKDLHQFFLDFAKLLLPVLVPGAHVIMASQPLLSHVVGTALEEAGLERRGVLIRLVQTLRGGDRPKNHEREFADVSVMPRSQWEPWLLYRKPFEGTVADCLRKWGTGGLRRIDEDHPFGDVIRSSPTSSRERAIARHPSLKPQAFMRQIVRASLPLGKGIVLDPFAGAGSTLAAANHEGCRSFGIEIDDGFYKAACNALPILSRYIG